MNVLILAAGDEHSTGDRAAYPIWLSELAGMTILERHVESFSGLQPNRFIFAFRREDVSAFHLDQIAALMAPSSWVIEIARQTQGAACTALLAIEAIDHEAELLIISATDLIDVDMCDVIKDFRARGAAAGTVSFQSIHPRYSYVRCDAAGDVIEVAEKRPISRNASAGLYWFARGGDLFAAVQTMIAKDASVNGQFFLAPALNELILRSKRVVTYPIALEQYHPIKTQQQIENLEQISGRVSHEA